MKNANRNQKSDPHGPPAVPSELDQLREKAWIGDAVLALFARRWILRRHGRMSAELFKHMTSNAFLSTLGNPTRLEAQIGVLFEKEGLEKAEVFMERVLVPQFEKQEKNRRKNNR